MYKSVVFLSIVLSSFSTLAQNVGIGTSTPLGKLQISHKATAGSPTLRLFDSTNGTGSSILFAKQNQGNSFSILSTIDLLSANSSLDFRTTFASGILLKGDGKVGINNTNPLAKLDVSGGAKVQDTLHVGGNLNLGAELKVNGDGGLPGQALMKNNAGQLSWQFQNEFRNIQSFRNTSSVTLWAVPDGVSRIKVELWGGGGGANGIMSGNSGAYLMAMLDVNPGDIWNITIGNGGQGSDPIGAKGDTTIFSRAGIKLCAFGGKATSNSSTISCASYSVTGTNNYIGIEGQTGRKGIYSYQNLANAYFIFIQGADGADAPLRPNSGGGSGWLRTNSDGSNGTAIGGGYGSSPGGGGGMVYGSGGDGMVIISW